MNVYRLPGKFRQRIAAPSMTIQREGATLHRFNISTSDKTAFKWFNENQLTRIEDNTMPTKTESVPQKYFKGDQITIGDMIATYDHFRKDKNTGEIVTHYLKPEGSDHPLLTVSAEQMRNIPDAEPYAVGSKVNHEDRTKEIVEARPPFYRLQWKSSPNNISDQWIHHDNIVLFVEEPKKPEKIAEPAAPTEADLQNAIIEELRDKLARMKAELDEHSTALAKERMKREQAERDLVKAKNKPTPISEADVIRRERDELREAVKSLADTKKERDQLRSQLALMAQERPKADKSANVIIATNETAANIESRLNQGFEIFHMQFMPDGKLNIVYRKQDNATALPAHTTAALTIPTRTADYATALNAPNFRAAEAKHAGNAAIFAAGSNAFNSYGNGE